MKTVVLVGNYGVGNFGDEALRAYFVRHFPDVTWRVLSARPTGAELPRLPGGLRSLCQPWWRTLRALWTADAVVFGGGSLLTDVESLYACVLWWWHARISHLAGRPIYLAFQGIGPFRTRLGAVLARSTVRLATTVSVRDAHSQARVHAWGMNKKIILSFDPVYNDFLASRKELSDIRSKNVFIIIPRSNPSKAFWSALDTCLEGAHFSAVRIVSLQPDHPAEQAACAAILQRLGAATELRPVRTLADLLSACADASAVLTQRYHGALLARAWDLPLTVIAQGPDDKLEALSDDDAATWPQRLAAGEAELREALSGAE